MSALNWVREHAMSSEVENITIKSGDEETPAGVYQVERFYFRGALSMKMKSAIRKELPSLIKEALTYEDVRMISNSDVEYWKFVYTLIEA